MATILSRVVDPADSVSLKHVIARQIRHEGEGTYVRFEGSPLPVGFRGEGRGTTWDLKILYGRDQHADAHALLDLLQRAFASSDGRLYLEPDGAKHAPLDNPMNVQVHGWDESRQPGGIIEISFSATEVM